MKHPFLIILHQTDPTLQESSQAGLIQHFVLKVRMLRLLQPKRSKFLQPNRSRSDSGHLLTHWLTDWALALTWLMWPWWVMIPIEVDGSYQLIEVINWWKFSTDGSYQLMEVFNWWKLSTYSLTDWLTYSLTLITSRPAHNAKKSAPVGNKHNSLTL